MGSTSEDAAKHPDGDSENKTNVTALESGSIPSADDADLMRLTGHKPVLERNFSLLSLLAFSFMVVDSWLGITSALAAGISSGGTVSLIRGLHRQHCHNQTYADVFAAMAAERSCLSMAPSPYRSLL